MGVVVTTQARVSSVPLTLLAVGGGSMRAVLRRVDEMLADQATRNAAGCLAQQAAARRDHERTVSDLTRLERSAAQPRRG
jgi:hypothetical protein